MKMFVGLERIAKIIKLSAFSKKVGLEKIHSFPEFGIINKNNYNSNSKNLFGFRNMLEKLENYFL